MATLSTPLVPKAIAGCIPAPATKTSVTTRLVLNQARFTVSGIGNPAEPGVGFEQGLSKRHTCVDYDNLVLTVTFTHHVLTYEMIVQRV